MAHLTLQHVGLTLGGQTLLHGVSLEVEPGEVVGLIGPNGSGKTTLFNVLSGFLPASTGRLTFAGRDVTKLAAHERARLGLGRVFQNFGIFRDMTLAENVLVAFEALSAEERAKLGDLHEAVTDTLRLVGLHHHPQQRASSLSGGQMRLLEIARTLRSRKTCILLDEPTAGVSPKMTGQVADLILQLKAEGKTVMIVEHDLPFISRICDRVVVLNEGRVFLQGTPRELEHNTQLRELYFGTLPAHT